MIPCSRCEIFREVANFSLYFQPTSNIGFSNQRIRRCVKDILHPDLHIFGSPLKKEKRNSHFLARRSRGEVGFGKKETQESYFRDTAADEEEEELEEQNC